MKGVETKSPEVKEKIKWKIPLDVVKLYNEKNDNFIINKLPDSVTDREAKWNIINFDGPTEQRKDNFMSSDLLQLFETNETIRKAFDKLPDHHKRQYILWIESSLNDDIRQERMERLVRIFSQRFNTF